MGNSILQYPLIKAVISIVSVVFIEIFGTNLIAYEILFILLFIDFLTGFSVGFMEGKLSSRKASRTVKKLLLYILLVVSAHQLTRYTPVLSWIEDGIVVYLSITELLSIFENAHSLGVPVPTWITSKLEKFRDTGKVES